MAQLNLEDVSRGLGFTRDKNGTEYVMWDRVNKYLEEFGFRTSVESAFIPENIFYRLAMKAKNETAEKFQVKVADEILPTIRKTGAYSVKQMSLEDLIILQAKSVKELKQEVKAIRQDVDTLKRGMPMITTHRMPMLSVASLPEPDETEKLRFTVNRIIRDYAKQHRQFVGPVWRELYDEFERRQNVNLVDPAKQKMISALRYAEREGHLEMLVQLALELYTDLENERMDSRG